MQGECKPWDADLQLLLHRYETAKYAQDCRAPDQHNEQPEIELHRRPMVLGAHLAHDHRVRHRRV